MMLNQLKNELDNLEQRNKLTKNKIANLFYTLEDATNTFKNNIVFKNHFATLRVEISKNIFDFLDFKSRLIFRLSSKLGNTLILLLLQQKVIKLQNKKEKFQQEIERIQKANETTFNYQEANQQLEQFWRDTAFIQQVTTFDIFEIRTFANLNSQLVVKILELMATLLNNAKYVLGKNNFQHFGDILEDPYKLVAALNKYDATLISEKQLSVLKQIHRINIQPQQFGLRALERFYQYIQAVVKFRESKQIQILSKLKRVQMLIDFAERQINIYKKILN